MHKALFQYVLCVAHTRIEGTWCAYCRNVPGQDHAGEAWYVLKTGDKLAEEIALAIFPRFKGIPYAR